MFCSTFRKSWSVAVTSRCLKSYVISILVHSNVLEGETHNIMGSVVKQDGVKEVNVRNVSTVRSVVESNCSNN